MGGGGGATFSSVADLFHEHHIFPDSFLPLRVPECYSDVKQNCLPLRGYTVHDRSHVLTDGHIGCSAFRPLPIKLPVSGRMPVPGLLLTVGM